MSSSFDKMLGCSILVYVSPQVAWRNQLRLSRLWLVIRSIVSGFYFSIGVIHESPYQKSFSFFFFRNLLMISINSVSLSKSQNSNIRLCDRVFSSVICKRHCLLLKTSKSHCIIKRCWVKQSKSFANREGNMVHFLKAVRTKSNHILKRWSSNLESNQGITI